MLDHDYAGNTAEKEPSECTDPRGQVSGVAGVSVPDQGGNYEANEKGNRMNPVVLPHYHSILFKILNVVHRGLRFEPEHEPSHVSPEKSFAYVVGVIISINMFVMFSMFGTPP